MFLKNAISKELFKVFSLNGLSVIIKICIGFISSKVIAIYIGPAGMALVGNLRNFTNSVESLITLGFQNGIVKYVAENKLSQEKLKHFFSVVFTSLFLFSGIVSVCMFFMLDYWNAEIFGTSFEYKIVFKCLALLLPWYASSVFFLAVINGLGKYKKVITINIITNILGLLVSVLLIVRYQTLGALLSIVITPALLFFITYYYINKEINFFSSVSFKKFDFEIIKYLSSFSLMALVSSVIGPIVFLAVRKFVIQTVGLIDAGYWETINRISSYYLLFATTILSIYFLPKLSVAKTDAETKSIFWSFYKYIFPVFIVGLIVTYFFRFIIVKTLFTEEFLPVASLFFWQLVGDALKIASWILAFNLLAKKMTKIYIITEFFSLGLTYFISVFFVNSFGVEGAVMAHALVYLIYFLALSLYFQKKLD